MRSLGKSKSKPPKIISPIKKVEELKTENSLKKTWKRVTRVVSDLEKMEVEKGDV